MPVPFTKRSLRIVTVVAGVIVLVLALVSLAYPSLRGYLGPMSQLTTAIYLGYMGAYVGYDWGVETTRKLRVVR